MKYTYKRKEFLGNTSIGLSREKVTLSYKALFLYCQVFLDQRKTTQ